MILLLLLILAALGSLLLLLRVVRRRRGKLSDPTGSAYSVDLEAFRNLVDPEEEDYLRRCLLPSQFRTLQRARMRAAVDYIIPTLRNTGVMLRLGQAAAISPDPDIAADARQLTQVAMRLRGYAMLALLQVHIRYIFPDVRLSAGRVAEVYQQANGIAGRLFRLQRPAQKTNLSAVL